MEPDRRHAGAAEYRLPASGLPGRLARAADGDADRVREQQRQRARHRFSAGRGPQAHRGQLDLRLDARNRARQPDQCRGRCRQLRGDQRQPDQQWPSARDHRDRRGLQGHRRRGDRRLRRPEKITRRTASRADAAEAASWTAPNLGNRHERTICRPQGRGCGLLPDGQRLHQSERLRDQLCGADRISAGPAQPHALHPGALLHGRLFPGRRGAGAATISVGKILDYTGKDDIETGRRLTQGAALMAMSALGKAGIPQVERFDTSVTELEIKFADNQLIGDQEQQSGVRRLIAGEIPGSGYHLIGGITELNYNIRSNEGEVLYDIVSFGARYYVMNIGLDLRLIHTKSLRVIETVSYQKQIIGRELRGGLFEFFDGKLLDLGLGERSLEPMQLAVRSVIERAVFELMRNLHHLPKDACEDRLYGPDLHLAGSVGKAEKEEKQAGAPKSLLSSDDAATVRKS
ncbi:MAG: hypothetical protein HC871_05765 [Rhizobiales bacterium]|nr:hypothetical protein [Hyphomicrobiales bacterium]